MGRPPLPRPRGRTRPRGCRPCLPSCVRSCCRRPLPEGEARWRRFPGGDPAVGLLELSPLAFAAAIERGYLDVDGLRARASAENPDDPYVVRLAFGQPYPVAHP